MYFKQLYTIVSIVIDEGFVSEDHKVVCPWQRSAIAHECANANHIVDHVMGNEANI